MKTDNKNLNVKSLGGKKAQFLPETHCWQLGLPHLPEKFVPCQAERDAYNLTNRNRARVTYPIRFSGAFPAGERV